MQALRVKIRAKEWLFIGSIGLFFSLSLTMLCYFLLGISLWHGLFFGMVLGLCLFLCAYGFTTLLNHSLLPRVDQTYWLFLAGISSFLVGVVATLLGYGFSKLLHVRLIEAFEVHLVGFSLFIGLLSYAVALLLYQFVALSHAKSAHEKLLIESRLKSLESQLNPHFLFNAINSLSELIYQNPQKAETILIELSDFLRFSMKEATLITLEEELSSVRRYVALENIRFGGSIVFEMHIDERGLNGLHVPKFSIQLLVENAIKHGMFDGRILCIWLDVRTQGESVTLRVSNDGKAINKESFGIGLRNLQERLALLLGGTIALENKNPVTFCITLRRETCVS